MSAVAQARAAQAAARADAAAQNRFVQIVVIANALIPLAYLLWDWRAGNLGANPIDYLTRATGTLALLFLVLTLAVTPLKLATGWGWLGKIRRTVGLFAFFYTSLHLLTYLVWDQEFRFGDIAEDVVKRKFITVGFAAWLLMVPLAITSTAGWVRRLGKKWRLLHKLTYLCAGLGILHFYLLLKVPTGKLWNYGMAVGLLLAVRVAVWAVKGLSQPAKKAPEKP